MRWIVSLRADGDRPMERDEIVELADAVASHEGIAGGIGTASYSAQIVVEAPTSDEAIECGKSVFAAAADRAGLPSWPTAWAESTTEETAFE